MLLSASLVLAACGGSDDGVGSAAGGSGGSGGSGATGGSGASGGDGGSSGSGATGGSGASGGSAGAGGSSGSSSGGSAGTAGAATGGTAGIGGSAGGGAGGTSGGAGGAATGGAGGATAGAGGATTGGTGGTAGGAGGTTGGTGGTAGGAGGSTGGTGGATGGTGGAGGSGGASGCVAPARTNLAIGAAASASVTAGSYAASRINDGSASTLLGGAYSWSNTGSVPAWVELDLKSPKRFGRMDLYTTQAYIIRDYDLQYYNGSTWVTLAAVRDNAQLSVTSTFPSVTAQRVRVLAIKGSVDQPGYARVNELEIYANQALSATASAQTTYSGYSAARVNDNSRNTALGGNTSWTNASVSLPQWLELDFGSCTSLDRVELLSTTGYIVQDYDLEYYDGSQWQTLLPVTGNVALHSVHRFSPISAEKLRVMGRKGSTAQQGYVRINELEVY